MVLFALVVVMIAVGGLTRLTDSGLSITEWAPISGAIPPLSAEDWQREFDAYRQIPEYQLQNRGMSLAEFKVIYWWEWGHRQLGRVIGLVWAVGFLGFLATRKIPPARHRGNGHPSYPTAIHRRSRPLPDLRRERVPAQREAVDQLAPEIGVGLGRLRARPE